MAGAGKKSSCPSPNHLMEDRRELALLKNGTDLHGEKSEFVSNIVSKSPLFSASKTWLLME